MSEIKIDQSQNGSSIEARTGDSIQVRLPENPSTGYLWQLALDPDSNLRFVSTDYEAASTRTIGGRGTRVFLFEAVSPGSSAIQLELKRPWEHGAPKNHFSVDLQVDSSKNSL